MNYCYISILPKNILLAIFRYLSKEDLSRIMRQSRKMYTIATDNVLWKGIAEYTGAYRYIPKEEENKPFAFYHVVNSFVLSIELPPISGNL
jgi:hypothetical protein